MSSKNKKQDPRKATDHDEEIVDEALDETFPASDPPASKTTTDDQDAAEEKKKRDR